MANIKKKGLKGLSSLFFIDCSGDKPIEENIPTAKNRIPSAIISPQIF